MSKIKHNPDRKYEDSEEDSVLMSDFSDEEKKHHQMKS